MKGVGKKTFLLVCSGALLYNALFYEPGETITRETRADRHLSIDLGDGQCKWKPPEYDVPEDLEFFKTLIAGFPSGDKRLTFVQLEALTGWAAKDEWDFEFLGMSNEPFVKANYPHHEGIWSWEDVADQVIMVVRNIRRSLVEYHDILWDIGYAKTWEEATLNLDKLYAERPPLEDFLEWRDLRVMDEIHWYGWFIDYYMENGLKRDIFTHNITTEKHWDMLMQPTAFSKDEVRYDLIVGDQEVTPSYDPMCASVTRGCHPVKVISAERLVETDSGRGPEESRRIAEAIQGEGKENISKYLIDESTWECIWTELIVNKKGLKTFIDREGVREHDYGFEVEMLEEMIHELDRLITKYSGDDWNTMETAQDLVELFVEHRNLINTEIEEVRSGERKLTTVDFLGPKERKRRKAEKLEAKNLKSHNPIANALDGLGLVETRTTRVLNSDNEDYSHFFKELTKAAIVHRRTQVKETVLQNDRRRKRKL